MEIHYAPIGLVHSPFTDTAGMPIQPAGAAGVRGTITVKPEFAEGLKDLEGFSQIILLYHFHRTNGFALRLIPFLDTESRGVFATRAPRRPNAIGLSVVRLVGVAGNELSVENLDILDGTPLIDIKPYVPEMDVYQAERIGWLEKSRDRLDNTRSDNRFE